MAKKQRVDGRSVSALQVLLGGIPALATAYYLYRDIRADAEPPGGVVEASSCGEVTGPSPGCSEEQPWCDAAGEYGVAGACIAWPEGRCVGDDHCGEEAPLCQETHCVAGE
jgi:hypothetical protein